MILLPLLAGMAASARAEDPPVAPASPFTGNINVTTNYKFRGQDQGTTRYFSPAVQGGFDWSQSGIYLGNWNSNVSFAGDIEMDFYGGYKGEIVKDVGYDVGILQYYYPQKNNSVDFNVTEVYGALTYQFLSFKYSHTVSKDYFGLGELARQNVPLATRPSGRNTGYFDLSANYAIIDKWTLNAHVGYTRYSGALRGIRNSSGADVGVPDYLDYKLGLTYDLGSGFSLAGAVIGANKKNYYGDVNKTRSVVTLSKTL